MLVVSNELAVRIRRERGLAGAGQAEEEGHIAVGTFVGRRVQRKVAKFDGLDVVHDGEDSFLHFASVLGTQNDHLFTLEVDLDGAVRSHSCRCITVRVRGGTSKLSLTHVWEVIPAVKRLAGN